MESFFFLIVKLGFVLTAELKAWSGYPNSNASQISPYFAEVKVPSHVHKYLNSISI